MNRVFERMGRGVCKEELEEGGLEEFVPGFATDAGGGREEHEQRRAAQEDEAPSGGKRG